MKNVKICFVVIALVLFCSLNALAADSGLTNFNKLNSYKEGMFSDVDSSSWYAENVQNAYELGLMVGSSDTTFNPSGNLKVSEALALACRLHNIYYGGNGSFKQGKPWYQVYVDYAVDKEIISPDMYEYTAC